MPDIGLSRLLRRSRPRSPRHSSHEGPPHPHHIEGSQVVAHFPEDVELHVILDNLNTHKPKHDRWLRRQPNVRFHFTPPHASWINQIRDLVQHSRTSSSEGSRPHPPPTDSPAIDAFIDIYNPEAGPFQLTKDSVHRISFTQRYTGPPN